MHLFLRLSLGAGIAAGLTGAALTIAGMRSPVIGALTMLFLLFTPAVCVALLLTGLDTTARAIVAGTAAIVLSASIAETMLVTSSWSSRGGVIAVATACAALVITAAVRYRLRSQPAEEEPETPDGDSWVFEP